MKGVGQAEERSSIRQAEPVMQQCLAVIAAEVCESRRVTVIGLYPNVYLLCVGRTKAIGEAFHRALTG